VTVGACVNVRTATVKTRSNSYKEGIADIHKKRTNFKPVIFARGLSPGSVLQTRCPEGDDFVVC
jgi:hypothetical protein